MEADPKILNTLRIQARNGATVADLIGIICRELQIEKDTRLLVFLYMRSAFFLSLPEVLPLGGWQQLGDGASLSDDDIQRQVMPAILRTKEKWDRA